MGFKEILETIDLGCFEEEERFIETVRGLRGLKQLIEEREKISGPEIFSDYIRQYLKKFKELKEIANKKFFSDAKLRRRICTFGRKAVSLGLKYLKFFPNRSLSLLESSYIELEKSNKSRMFRRKCLERALELMERHEDEGVKVAEFIGRRVEAYLDLGQLERDKSKKIEYFLRAYNDSIRQIEDLNDSSDEALFKLVKICSLFSGRDVGEKLEEKKREMICKGIEISERCREIQLAGDNYSNPIIDNILGFFYIRKARLDNSQEYSKDFQRGLSLLRDCLSKLNPRYHNYMTTLILSYASSAFSEAYEIKAEDRVGPEDLEDLVTGIICSELSGNTDSINYQAIGRGYYRLQHLIERSSRGEVGIKIVEIKESIKRVLRKNGRYEEIFVRYKGGLRDIADLEDG